MADAPPVQYGNEAYMMNALQGAENNENQTGNMYSKDSDVKKF